jgi:hypothetical protein
MQLWRASVFFVKLSFESHLSSAKRGPNVSLTPRYLSYCNQGDARRQHLQPGRLSKNTSRPPLMFDCLRASQHLCGGLHKAGAGTAHRRRNAAGSLSGCRKSDPMTESFARRRTSVSVLAERFHEAVVREARNFGKPGSEANTRRGRPRPLAAPLLNAACAASLPWPQGAA